MSGLEYFIQLILENYILLAAIGIGLVLGMLIMIFRVRNLFKQEQTEKSTTMGSTESPITMGSTESEIETKLSMIKEEILPELVSAKKHLEDTLLAVKDINKSLGLSSEAIVTESLEKRIEEIDQRIIIYADLLVKKQDLKKYDRLLKEFHDKFSRVEAMIEKDRAGKWGKNRKL